ncbi:MAG: aldehyde dehydrogenase family protein [Acidobacteria bacterium]|nr:aldehyde dehydrogenase family protein [Acidobacteriota bacterium]
MGQALLQQTIISINPATGETLAEIPISTPEDVHQAVTRAWAAFPEWARRSFAERGRVILEARQNILDHLEEIVEVIYKETGKPRTEALSSDVMAVLDLMTYYAQNTAKLLRRERIPLGKYSLMGRSSYVQYGPLGVIGIISPWNFPFAIPVGEVVMALMVGNTVVLKPSEYTPLVGLKIGEIFQAVGLPEGVLTVVPGDGSTGAALAEADVKKIFFTGSVATGRKVMMAAAKNLTPVVLELGGKDPMIVCRDADVEVASSAAVWGAFVNSGQVCASVERCYVDEAIADEFIGKVVDKTRRLRQGPNDRVDTDIGSLANENQLRVVENQVSEAIARGATVLCGGERNRELGGYYFKPTVLINVDHTFTIMRDETFGPVLPIMSFKTEEEAIRLANDSHYGLTASVWTTDIERGKQLAAHLEAGTIMINEIAYTHALPQTPWGGVKQSGIGRTHSKWGLIEMAQVEHVHINRMARTKDPWWYGYSRQLYQVLIEFSRRITSPSWLEKLTGIPTLLRGQRLKKY